MYSFKFTSCILVAISLLASLSVSKPTENATNVANTQNTNFPINAVGNVVAIQGTNNAPAMLVYQDSNSGYLVALRVSNVFSVGHPTAQTLLVPPSEVQWGTPLAITQYVDGVNTFGSFELFYFTPNNTLAAVAWNTLSSEWLRGSNCPVCIDKAAYRVVPGSKILYAMSSTEGPMHNADIAVGFESPNYPGTISEAQRLQYTWNLYPLTSA